MAVPVRLNRFWERWGFAVVALLFSLSLPLLDYVRQDTVVSYIYEVWLLLLVHALVAGLFLWLYNATLKTAWAKLLATSLAVFALLQHFPRLYDLGSKFGGFLPAGTIRALVVTLGVLFGLWLGCWLVERYIAAATKQQASLFTLLAFIGLTVFAFNVYSFFKAAVTNHQASVYVPKDNSAGVKLAQTSDRDIYYIVMDRYASQKSLQQNFQYDNSQFLNSLRDQGFTVREDAVSNYQFTAPSISSTVRMDYHTDIASDLKDSTNLNSLPYENIIKNSPTSKLLSGAGYGIYNLGNWWNVTRRGYNSTDILPEFELTLFNHKRILSELQSDALQRSFLQPLLGAGLKLGSYDLAQITFDGHAGIYLDQSKELVKLAQTQTAKPKFVFAHFLMPHPPYVFDANGQPATYNGDDNNNGLQRRDKYINQLQFANSSILQTLASIKAGAKKPPIIIIQADEGPYPLEAVSKWEDASPQTLLLKMGTLAAYQLPDTSPEEATAINSSVNIFRFVFNKYFGASMNYLPDCSYVFNGQQPFKFYDITSKLHAAAPECSQYDR